MTTNTTQNIYVINDTTNAKKNLFAILLTGEVLSVPCYIFIFYHLLRDKNLRKSLQNHAIFILLIFNFIHMMIDLSLTLDFYRVGYRSPFFIPLCFIQAYVDYGIWYGGIHSMFWISIERHILIFHSTLLGTRRKRFLFHYFPLITISFYAPILYFYLVILYPCQRPYTILANFCGTICYASMVPKWFIWFESIVNYVSPILMIALLNSFLIIRVIVKRRRLQQATDWRRYRKMISQMFLISSVYLVFDLPYVIATIASWFGIILFQQAVLQRYIGSFTYMPAVLLPLAVMFTLPQLKQKIRALMFWKTIQRLMFPPTRAT